MPKKALVVTAASLLAVTLLGSPVSASEMRGWVTRWVVKPDVDTPHPSEKVLALQVQDAARLVTCRLWYGHDRHLIIVHGEGDEEHRGIAVGVPRRAKIKVTFDVERGDETIRVGKRKVKLKKWYKWGQAGWVDASGDEGGERGFKTTATLPVDLEAGDVLLFSLWFTKMPDLLGLEETEEGLRRDTLWLRAECSSCGSNDTPCSEPN